MKPGWHPKTFGVADTNVGGCIHLRQYLVLPLGTMTVLEALAILESATLECKKREVNTPEVRDALDLLEPHIKPDWLIPQFRHHGHLLLELAVLALQELLANRETSLESSLPGLSAPTVDHAARDLVLTAGGADRQQA